MKNRDMVTSFYHAWQGVRHAAVHERNMKIHIAAAVAAIAACVILRVAIVPFLFVVFAIFTVLCMELVNTAIEALADLCCDGQFHPLVKVAKDVGAGAVLLASAQAVIVGLVVFVPKLPSLWNAVLSLMSR